MRRRITSSAAQKLALLDDKDSNEIVEIISEQHLSMRGVKRTLEHRQTSQQQGELCSDLDAHRPDASERRAHAVDRVLAKAVTSLKMDMYRLGGVVYDLEDEPIAGELFF